MALRSLTERLLVTGSTGFLGSHFMDLVRQDPRYQVREFSGNVCSKEDVVRNLRGVDTVINFAALTYLPPSWDSARAYMNVNYGGVLNFLANNRMFGRFVQISTSHVYGDQPEVPIRQDVRPLPRDPYAIAKLAAEEAVKAYSERYGFDFLVIRPFNNFGPRQSVHFVVPAFCRQALSSARIVVRGDTKREFLYVKDNIKVVKALLDRGTKGLIHVCKGETYRVSYMAQLVLAAVGVSGRERTEIVRSDRPVYDIRELYGDPTELNSILPDHRWTPMEQAVKETVDFYRDH